MAENAASKQAAAWVEYAALRALRTHPALVDQRPGA